MVDNPRLSTQFCYHPACFERDKTQGAEQHEELDESSMFAQGRSSPGHPTGKQGEHRK